MRMCEVGSQTAGWLWEFRDDGSSRGGDMVVSVQACEPASLQVWVASNTQLASTARQDNGRVVLRVPFVAGQPGSLA